MPTNRKRRGRLSVSSSLSKQGQYLWIGSLPAAMRIILQWSLSALFRETYVWTVNGHRIYRKTFTGAIAAFVRRATAQLRPVTWAGPSQFQDWMVCHYNMVWIHLFENMKPSYKKYHTKFIGVAFVNDAKYVIDRQFIAGGCLQKRRQRSATGFVRPREDSPDASLRPKWRVKLTMG